MSGRSDTGRHEPDQVARSALLNRGNSTARQRRAPPGKDSIPLLKRVSQVRILPGAQPKRPPLNVEGWSLTATFDIYGIGHSRTGRLLSSRPMWLIASRCVSWTTCVYTSIVMLIWL